VAVTKEGVMKRLNDMENRGDKTRLCQAHAALLIWLMLCTCTWQTILFSPFVLRCVGCICLFFSLQNLWTYHSPGMIQRILVTALMNSVPLQIVLLVVAFLAPPSCNFARKLTQSGQGYHYWTIQYEQNIMK
jgi:flagellar biosynthesis protein FlhB